MPNCTNCGVEHDESDGACPECGAVGEGWCEVCNSDGNEGDIEVRDGEQICLDCLAAYHAKEYAEATGDEDA